MARDNEKLEDWVVKQMMSGDTDKEIDPRKWQYKKQDGEKIDMRDWSDGDPRGKMAGEPIVIDANIDYDAVNAFWIQQGRKKKTK